MILRSALLLLGALALASCSSRDGAVTSSTTEVSKFLQQQIGLRRAGSAPKTNVALLMNREMLKTVTDPLIRTRTEKTGAMSLLYVSQRNGDSQIWFSPDSISITMQSGVFVQTRGVGYDLYSADAAQMIAVVQGKAAPGPARRLHRELDASNAIVQTEYACAISDMGKVDVTVLERTYKTTHYREDCRASTDSFVNEYWVDSSRIVRVSRQQISPEFGHVFTERLVD